MADPCECCGRDWSDCAVVLPRPSDLARWTQWAMCDDCQGELDVVLSDMELMWRDSWERIGQQNAKRERIAP